MAFLLGVSRQQFVAEIEMLTRLPGSSRHRSMHAVRHKAVQAHSHQNHDEASKRGEHTNTEPRPTQVVSWQKARLGLSTPQPCLGLRDVWQQLEMGDTTVPNAACYAFVPEKCPQVEKRSKFFMAAPKCLTQVR